MEQGQGFHMHPVLAFLDLVRNCFFKKKKLSPSYLVPCRHTTTVKREETMVIMDTELTW